MRKIQIKINNKKIICSPEQTIMEAARLNGIEIPGLCSHPDFPAKANCRVCLVEIKGWAKLATSCSTKVEDGMEIRTDSERVKKLRNLNIELLFAEHIEKCPTCIWRFNCQLLKLAEKYKIEITRFADRKKRRKIYKFANAVEIDGSQCIDCRNCLDACSVLQNINYLKLKGKGTEQEIVPVDADKPLFRRGATKKIDCIYCGQCTVHCPVGAAQEQTHWEMVEKALKDKSKTIVAQFAPSIRVSIGEEFGLPYGKAVTGQVVAGLRRLGFNYVFDVNFSADITTIVEAEELAERIKNTPQRKTSLPMFTSCCPAWIKYLEFYHPELIPNITTSRSPQMHGAGIIKTYWAEQLKINPKNIVVVSVMPCTAKKFEASRPELKITGNWPIDYVITTREFAWLLKKNNIDFPKLKPSLADNPLGSCSGAAAIYGVSGGVIESVLRTVQYLIQEAQVFACAKKLDKKRLGKFKLEFNDFRGLAGIKEATVDLAGVKVRVAVVNGIGQIEQILEKLKEYDYIEVMACPGGCIGGGGQPIPTTPGIRQKRLEALYKIDKKSRIRKAHENKAAVEVLNWLRKQDKLEREVLYTSYKRRS